MIKFEDINVTYNQYRSGVRFITVPIPVQHNRSSLKEKKRVDASSMTKTKVVPGVYRYSGKLDDSRDTTFEFFHVSKRVGKYMIRHSFATEKEALRSIDMFLIREGKQPKYTLKKND